MNLRERYTVQADPLKTERRIELAALLLAALFVLQLLFGGVRLALLGVPEAVPPAPDTLLVGEVAATAGLSPEESAELLARPLFWESRRPGVVRAEQTSSKEVEEAASLEGVQLVGVFGAGDSAGIIALVQGKKQRILRGEKVSGWTLQSVEPTSIVLVNKGRRKVLELHATNETGSDNEDSRTRKLRKR